MADLRALIERVPPWSPNFTSPWPTLHLWYIVLLYRTRRAGPATLEER
jgi:hypothetical protein